MYVHHYVQFSQLIYVHCTERMVRRAQEGIKCTNYRPLDYEKLRSEITERKHLGQEALLKLKCIKAASRQQKEENLGKQHCIVWQHELTRLGTLRQQLQSELSMMLLSLVDSDNNQLKQIFQDFHSFQAELEDDFIQFKENTTDAVQSLGLSCIFLIGIRKVRLYVVCNLRVLCHETCLLCYCMYVSPSDNNTKHSFIDGSFYVAAAAVWNMLLCHHPSIMDWTV